MHRGVVQGATITTMTSAEGEHQSVTHAYTAAKGQLLSRLSRVEGQVRGVKGNVEQDRYCIVVLTLMVRR